MRKSRLTDLGLAAVLAFLLACSGVVPATVTRREPIPLDRDAAIHVFASQERAAIIDSLERAGLHVSADFKDLGYALEVRIGRRQGRDDCGTLRNVSYKLMAYGRSLIVIKARGAIGDCHPNVLDEMSRTLVENMN